MAFDAVPGEALSRYIFDPKRIRADGSLRHALFEPPNHGRLSVYWTTGLGDAEIWQICTVHVTPIVGKPSVARADINSLHVYAEELAVDVNGEPHPRHANIVGWSPEPTKRRLQAAKLASLAVMVRPPA